VLSAVILIPNVYKYIIYIYTHTHVYISCPYTCTYTHRRNTHTQHIYTHKTHTHTHTHQTHTHTPNTCTQHTYTHASNTYTHTHTHTRTLSLYNKSMNFKYFVTIVPKCFQLLVNSSRDFLRTYAVTRCLDPQLQDLHGVQNHYCVWQPSVVSSPILDLQVELVVQWAKHHTWLRA